jgi:tetratricopeptide (TPR) repeat protein
VDLEEAKKAIQRLSPDGLCLGGLLDLRGVASDVVDKVVGAFLLGLFGVSPIGSLVGTGIAALASKSLRWLLERRGNETIKCLRNIVNAAKEASQYIDDEGLRGVVEEIAKKWGWDVDTFRRFVKTAAGKSVTEDEVREMIEEALKRIEEELESIKRNIEEELRKVESKTEGSKIGIGIFFLNDVENGLLYGNFIVEGGVPRIKTLPGTAKNELVTNLVDAGKFRAVAEDVLSRLTRDGRVMLTGPRGIGKSTLATYVAWSSLLGGLGKVVLDKSMDAVIRVDSLNPGDALELNNLIKTAGRRFIIIYDPSPIKAYYKPEAMQMAKHDIESIKKTLKELMEVENAWVIIVLPKELYDEVSKDAALKSVLDEVRNYVINVDLKDEGFLREIIKRYSGCGNVREDLVKGVMGFDSYTLLAKYVGVWLSESKCKVESINNALMRSMRSAGEPKLFFANYIWGTILRGSRDLARRVSIPLILHAAFGPIPEGVTYITKAVNEGGVWGLVSINRLAESELRDLREVDLEPIAKWLSTLHEDLIEETLKELVGLRGEEARNNYRNHGFENLINALYWGYREKALEEVRGLSREVKPEEIKANLLIFVSERLKHALKPYTNCWRRAALIIGHALVGYDSMPKPENLPKDLPEDAKYLRDALRKCGVDDYLLVGDEIPPLIQHLIKNHAHALVEAFIDKYSEVVAEVRRVLGIARDRIINATERLYWLGLASIIAKAIESGKPIEPDDADAALRIVFTVFIPPDYVKPVLRALEPLRNKAPHRYLELQVSSLVHAMDDYISQLSTYRREDVVDKIADLLNDLDGLSPSLGVIAWARVLTTALEDENVRGLIERRLGNAVNKANEVLRELSKLKEKVQELMMDEVFMGYVESKELMRDKGVMDYVEFKSVKADEKAVRRTILKETLPLKRNLAQYKLRNGELDDAARLFNEAAEIAKEIREIRGSNCYEVYFKDYLINRGWALRTEAVESSLVGDELVKLVNKHRQLFEKAEECYEYAARYRDIYLNIASHRLSEYLVSLALTGGDKEVKEISELLRIHWQELNANERVSILTRLMLDALLNPKGGLGDELWNRLNVKSWELIKVFRYEMDNVFLPALRVAFGVTMSNDEIELCNERFNDDVCIPVLAARENDDAVKQLRGRLINAFRKRISEEEVLDSLKGLIPDPKSLFKEFKGLVDELDGRSLVQLIAPISSMAQFILMLYALLYTVSNDNERLAKAHALMGTVYATDKLLMRLFYETYRACCDPNNEEFRRAIVKLFLALSSTMSDLGLVM